MNNHDNILSFLGLAAKAGKVRSGEFMTEKTVKERKARLVIIATDTSETSKKNYKDMCAYYHVPIYEYGSKEELGHAIGKEFRTSAVVTDEGFASGIIKKIQAREEHR